MIQAVIFDMDGLMFDTERLMVEGWMQAGKEAGIPISKELVYKTVGVDRSGTRAIFQTALGDSFDFSSMHRSRVKYVSAYIEAHGVPVKDGVIDTIKYLHEHGYKLAVAASTERETVCSYLQKTNLINSFQVIVCGNMVEHSKPEPDIFLEAAAQLRIVPENCLVLEDSPSGIQAAFKARMKAVMVPDLIKPEFENAKDLCICLKKISDITRRIQKI